MLRRLRAMVRGFFGFSRTETNAFLIMLPLMVVMVFSAPCYKWWMITHVVDDSVADSNRLDSLLATWKWEKHAADTLKRQPHFFNFDPNTASHQNLISLGLSEKLTRRILHFRDKGGKFKIKKDLGKIYGMDTVLFARLIPFIRLPEKIIPQSHYVKSFPDKVIPLPFDLNMADTSQLIRINGIGPKLSLRITAYRDKLGGFVSADQLQEVYGLDTSVIHQLKKKSFIAASFTPKQTNINTADEKKLASLPYIRFALAKSIVVYRFQHGNFDSIEGLLKIALMDESTFRKIKPYITVKD